jgi:hypothetical protein
VPGVLFARPEIDHPDGRVADRLYKYLSAECAAELFGHGRIRVGTLHEYRNTAGHRQEVADRREGSRRIVVDVSSSSHAHAAGAEVARAVREHGLDEHEDTDVEIVARRGSEIVVEAHSPNLWLFSASRRCDRELMRCLEYDACVEITRPDEFFRAIGSALPAGTRFLGYRDVIYEDPRSPRPREAGVHPAFFKRIEYAYQAEVRALWEPGEESATIEPVVVTCSEAARCCEMTLSRERVSG